MSEVQIAIIDQENTQIALAVPGVQGPAGAISSGGSANQVFYKVSGTNYDAGWTFIGNANVDAAAAIAGTKISPNFGSQTVATTGVFSHALGSQGAPTITFTGDTNTGIYSPGADQVAISTNGAGRLFVDASGNVGISMSSPISNAGYGGLSINGTDGAILSMMQGGSETFRVTNATGYSFINTTGATPLLFGTAANERLRITSAGLVGIGTSSPSHALTVNGAISSLTGVIRAEQGANAGFVIGSRSAQTDFQLYNTGNVLRFYNGSLDALSINTSGNVGIGTTSPTRQLDVNSTAIFDSNGNGTTTSPSIAIGSSGVGFSYIGSQQLAFLTNSNERARIDSSGRLLVGTSTTGSGLPGQADQKFQVAGGTDGGITMSTFSADPYACNLEFRKSRSGSVGTKTIVQSGDTLGKFYYCGADGTNFIPAAAIEAFVDATPGANDMPGRLVFSTTADGASSPTERMRINSAGQTRILGGSAPLTVRTTLAAGTSDWLFLGYRSATNISDGVDVIDIFTNGNIVNTNNSYGAISDAKLKENIADSGSQWSDLKRLKVRKYNFKEETGRDVHTQIGLVAQEVELVSPGLVTESPDRDAEGNDLGTVTKSVNYSVLYMKAVKALQEAMERIETLEAKVAALESA